MSAAALDNFIVYAAYGILCALLHWRVGALDRLWVLLAAGIAYHFVLEANGGQTVGKRRYGVQVVGVDGTPITARAAAIRSVLRIFDQLPLLYVSGLVSMVRTGPARRQRMGDVAAGTVVIAVGGRAERRGTPGWMLPTAAVVTTLISAFSVYAVTQANSSPLDATQQEQFISGCQQSVAGRIMNCACALTQLRADGYDTIGSLHDLMTQGRAESFSGSVGPARRELTTVVRVCRQ